MPENNTEQTITYIIQCRSRIEGAGWRDWARGTGPEAARKALDEYRESPSALDYRVVRQTVTETVMEW